LTVGTVVPIPTFPVTFNAVRVPTEVIAVCAAPDTTFAVPTDTFEAVPVRLVTTPAEGVPMFGVVKDQFVTATPSAIVKAPDPVTSPV